MNLFELLDGYLGQSMKVHGTWRYGTIAVLLLALAAPSGVRAEPGDGLKAGDVTLVPKLTLSGGYDTNIYRLADDETSRVSSEYGAANGRITPGLEIFTASDRAFTFDLDSSLTWEQYFSSASQARSQSGLSANVGAGMHINKTGNFSLRLEDSLERTNEPPPSVNSLSFNRIGNTFGAIFGIHPGARIIDSKLNYHLDRYWHQTSGLEQLDRTKHRFGLNLQYNFLPKTGIFLNSSYNLIRYDEPNGGDADRVSHLDSSPLRIKAGVSGLITRRLSLKGSAGYGLSFYDGGEQFRGVIGDASIGYSYGRMDLDNVLQLGYRYGFEDATLGNFYTSHRMILKWQQGLVDNKLRFKASGSFSIRDYTVDLSALPNVAGDSNLEDQLLRASAGLGYDMTKWWSAGLDYNLTLNATDDEFLVATGNPDEPSLPVLREYVRHRVFLSTTIRY